MNDNNGWMKPSVSLLIKLGSLITHYEEYVSADGHELDLVAAKSLTEDREVREWLSQMNAMAFLPLKRNLPQPPKTSDKP